MKVTHAEVERDVSSNKGEKRNNKKIPADTKVAE
jgi:hypothetical protein